MVIIIVCINLKSSKEASPHFPVSYNLLKKSKVKPVELDFSHKCIVDCINTLSVPKKATVNY